MQLDSYQQDSNISWGCLVSDGVDIQTKGLSKDFGPIQAAKDLNLSVRKGSVFGFLGPNGAGKTITVRILSGLLKQSSGIATLCGSDVSTQRDEIKSVTGLLPETPDLNDLSGSKLESHIDKLLSILGLESRQNDLLESYSSGMKQKVLVASTFIHDPQLVFLDEPTSRLDPAASVLVKELILVMATEMDTTFFICTHMVDFAQETCEVIGILNEGKLIVLDTPQEIVSKTKADDLEDAYLKLVGGEVDRSSLLSWRAD
jgi:ABC-2 type transport system ATP-binding protein